MAAAVAAPTLEQVLKDNEELKKKIAALRDKLGITAEEEKKERARVEDVFKMFDRDGNGYIDKNEFDMLAFECGADVASLTEDKLKASFAQLNPKGDGKITFDDFYKWLKTARPDEKKADAKDAKAEAKKAADLGLLQLKLQSRAWLKSFTDLRAGVKKADEKKAPAAAAAAKDEKKAPAPAAAAAVAAGAPAGGPAEKFLNLQLSVGELKDPKGGIELLIGGDAKIIQDTREEINCPENIQTFVLLEFGLKDGYDEGKVAELCGIVDALLNGIPWNRAPMPLYHSHSVDPADSGGKKVLRISIFSPLDPENMMQGMGFELRLQEILKLALKLDIPFAADEMMNDAFRLNAATLILKLAIAMELDPRLRGAMDRMMAGAGGALPAQVKGLMGIFFLKGLDLQLQFAGIEEFVRGLPAEGRGRRSLAMELKGGLQSLEQMPLGMMLQRAFRPVQQVLKRGLGQEALYELIKTQLAGPSRIHIQSAGLAVRLNFKGMNIFSWLPDSE